MLLKLFLSFAYIGAFTFGGGYAMLPMFKRVLAEKNKWLEDTEITDLFSISQCLPGLLASNTAVFVGYKQKGVSGSIVSVIGVALPSVVFILILAALITNISDYPVVQRAFVGLRVCVSVLIVNAVTKLWKNAVVDKPAILIFIIVFLVAVFTNLPVAILIVIAGCSGIAITNLRKGTRTDGGAK